MIRDVKDKKNFSCECGGEFTWYVSRPAETKEEREHLKAWGEDEDEDLLDNPRNAKEWAEAELFDTREPYEPNEVDCLSDFDECCQKELIKHGIFKK